MVVNFSRDTPEKRVNFRARGGELRGILYGSDQVLGGPEIAQVVEFPEHLLDLDLRFLQP